MMCRPMWPFLLMYESHDMRHTGFPQVDGGQRDPQEMGRHRASHIHWSNFRRLDHPQGISRYLFLLLFHIEDNV